MKSGQMFVVTIVFLIGMVFVVQQSLLRYNDVTVTDIFFLEDHEILLNVESSIQKTLDLSPSCSDAQKNMEELMKELGEGRIRGFRVNIVSDMNCNNWKTTNAVVNATIYVEGQDINTNKQSLFYRL